MDEGLAGLADGYGFTEPAVGLGRAIKGEEVNTGFEVAVPLAMLNRHGLVAGATGTGKTKTVQGLAGRLSDAGVSCFVADMKGDVSGMAEPGEASDKVAARIEQLKAAWEPRASPVELLTLSGDPARGVPVRASVSEFGRPCWPRSSTSTTSRRACSAWSSTTPTRAGCCWSTSRTCARC